MVRAVVEATLERLPLEKSPKEEDFDVQFFDLLVNQFFDLLESSVQYALSGRATLEFKKPTLKNQIALINTMGRRDQAENCKSSLGHLESRLKDLEDQKRVNIETETQKSSDRLLIEQRLKWQQIEAH